MSDDFDFEPVRGLPENLPPGEQLLWQGAPSWQALARRAFHTREIAVYFAALLAWRFAHGISIGLGVPAALAQCGWLLLLSSVALGLVTGIAWLSARTTVYTITDKRVVMRYGNALPMSVNIPFRLIAKAAAKIHATGDGDLALQLESGERIGYLLSWPHVRPWFFTRPQPTLRAIPQAATVANLLSVALAANAESPVQVTPARAHEPISTAAGLEPRSTVAA